MSNVERYAAPGVITSHKGAPTGMMNRLQLKRAVDRAATDKQLSLIDAEKEAIVQKLEADLIRMRMDQDASNEVRLQQVIVEYLNGYIHGTVALTRTTQQAAESNPAAAEILAAAEAVARRLLDDHTAAGAAALDPRIYRR